jgi:type II secretory pathway component GspD/PulD (secretin)
MQKLFYIIIYFIFINTSFLSASELGPQQDIITETLDILEQEQEMDSDESKGSQSVEEKMPDAEYDSSNLSGLGIEPMIESVDFEEERLSTALDIIALKTGLDIVYDANISGSVTLSLKNIEVWDILQIILDLNGMRYVQSDGVVRVMSKNEWEVMKKINDDKWDHKAALLRLEYCRPRDVITEAEKIQGRTGKLFRDSYHKTVVVLDRPEIIKKIEAIARRIDVPVITEILSIPISAQIDQVREKVKGLITPGVGRFEINETSRTISVTDVEAKTTAVREMIKAMDLPSEIKMRVKILGILLNEEHRDGVDWEAIVSKYQQIKAKGGDNWKGFAASNLSTGVLSEEDIKILVEALDTVGTISIFLEGEADMPCEDINRLVIDWYNAFETGQVEAVEQMKAFVMDVRYIPSDPVSKVSIDAAFPSRRGRGYFQDTTPSLLCQEGPDAFTSMPTVIDVGSGETIIMGGLMESIEIDQEKRLPVLGKIPFVWPFLFATQSKKSYNVETVIFLTPIITSGKEIHDNQIQ